MWDEITNKTPPKTITAPTYPKTIYDDDAQMLSKKKQSKMGLAIGLSVGFLVVIIIILLVVMLLIIRRKNLRSQHKEENPVQQTPRLQPAGSNLYDSASMLQHGHENLETDRILRVMQSIQQRRFDAPIGIPIDEAAMNYFSPQAHH